MRVDWKRVILELILQTLVELAPVSFSNLAALAEYVVQLAHTPSTASLQTIVFKTEQQYEGTFWAFTACKFSSPSLS